MAQYCGGKISHRLRGCKCAVPSRTRFVLWQAGNATLLTGLCISSWGQGGSCTKQGRCSCHLEAKLLWSIKIKQIGVEPDLIGSLPKDEVYRFIKGRLLDLHTMNILSAANKKCLPLYYRLPVTIGKIPVYLYILECPKIRRAFTWLAAILSHLQFYGVDLVAYSSKKDCLCPWE